MGFDVDAYHLDEGSATSRPHAIRAAFGEAERWLIENAGGCDAFISLGSLDCSQSIQYLERAIGRTFEPSVGDIWSSEEVRRLSEAAVWPDAGSVPADERWAFWSARKFLEVCVRHGLGIRTS